MNDSHFLDICYIMWNMDFLRGDRFKSTMIMINQQHMQNPLHLTSIPLSVRTNRLVSPTAISNDD